MLYAIVVLMRKYGFRNKLAYLFLFYTVILIAIVVFEFVEQLIPLLFIARCMAMIGNVWQFQLLVKPFL
jgi:hypothetical protein